MGRLRDTLPSHLSLAQVRQLNEQCNRFEAAWRAGRRPRIEDYLADDPAGSPTLQQLILLDIDYRRQHGDDRFRRLDPPRAVVQLADDADARERLIGRVSHFDRDDPPGRRAHRRALFQHDPFVRGRGERRFAEQVVERGSDEEDAGRDNEALEAEFPRHGAILAACR